MSNYHSDKQYEGPESIVVAMDIGTTQSAVSFTYFVSGIHPQAQTVTHWTNPDYWIAKTPSLVSYQNGVVKACGAEAMKDFQEHRENVAYWFKLHLHPTIMSQANHLDFEIPPLPAGVTIEGVYSDLMKHLMEHTQSFFETTIPKGKEIWARLRNGIVVILATPNGWDIREQATLRRAAIRASLVTEENAGQLVQFVAEAEASVHYVLANPYGNWLERRTVFAVIDCGGSTVDITVYRCVSTSPFCLKETCPSKCIQTGGVFVDRRIENMLRNRLKDSTFSDPEIIRNILAAFEKEVKPNFDGIKEEYDPRFDVNRYDDPSLGIHRGRIALSNDELKSAFDPIINEIVKSCSSVILEQKVEYVLIVGGFGESPYVRKALSQKLDPHGIQIITAGDSVKKAAAEGAMIGHIKQFVVARAAKATFGGCVRPVYNRNVHRERKHTIKLYPDGKKRVDGAFHTWIKKGTVLQGTFAHKLSYHVAWEATSTSKSELTLKLRTVEIEVFAWERDDAPTWCKDEHGAVLDGMRLICTLKANLSALAEGLQIRNGPRGTKFYRVDYDVCVYFGGTQLYAKLQWKEGRSLREGPVAVMPYVS